ncbi:DNA-directed RNA polymerases I and III subunit RPAC2-like [Convolutriloba macropyga]|uniref:DNA-directed RNA polymerases I and III subunit RPAC2-like n=1 Tax=Convolutriloba macropyga TaxID=536237 RepID=UPI003F51EB22
MPGAEASDNSKGATFSLENEDHTLANSLRYMLNKSLHVEFAGYSIPHPSEKVVNVRVQTTGEVTAHDAFREALGKLAELCVHMKTTFEDSVSEYESKPSTDDMDET